MMITPEMTPSLCYANIKTIAGGQADVPNVPLRPPSSSKAKADAQPSPMKGKNMHNHTRA
jgi:hypothetical protein